MLLRLKSCCGGSLQLHLNKEGKHDDAALAAPHSHDIHPSISFSTEVEKKKLQNVAF